MTDIPALIQAEASAQGVDPAFAMGIWHAEGATDGSRDSPKGAIGPMQLMPGTAAGLGIDPRRVDQNIHGGVKYLKQQLDTFGGDQRLAAAAYNAGPGAVQKHGGVPPFPETQGYVDKATGAVGPSGADIFGDGSQGAAADAAGGSDIFADPPSGAAGDPAADPGAPAQPNAPGPSPTIKLVGGKIVFGDTNEEVPAAQVETIQTLQKGGMFNADAQAGSANLPYVQRSPNDSFKPGEYYIEASDGAPLKQTPGAKNPDGGFVAGVGAGLGDVPNSILKMLPGHENSDIYNADEAHRIVYDASHQGDTGAAAGRFTGQVLGSAPLIAGGEGLLGALATKAPAAAAPLLDFLAGNAGRTALATDGAKVGGNLLTRGASLAARGAQEGAAGGALTSDSSSDPLAKQIAMGAATGAIMRNAVPLVGGGLGKVLGGAPASPAVADLAQTAVQKYGIPLRVTQIKGVTDPVAAVHDSEMLARGVTGYANNQGQQTKAFARAIAKTFGEDADKLSPEVMSAAKGRIGGVFNRVAQNTNIGDTSGLVDSLKTTLGEAAQVLPDSEVKPLHNLATNIASTIHNGVLSGESYQALTRKGSPLDVAAHGSNSNLRAYAQQMREALDDALEAHAAPEDVSDLQNARWQYKNLMTVKNLAAKANVEGDVSPALLNGAVNTSFKNRAFTGAGDLGELAQIGQTFLKQPGNSQTAPRIADKVRNFLSGPALMGALYMLEHDPHLAIKMGVTGGAIGGVRAALNGASGAINRSSGAVGRIIGTAQKPSAADNALRLLGQVADPSLVPAGVIAQRNGLFGRNAPGP